MKKRSWHPNESILHKSYYVFFNVDNQTYEVIDCTCAVKQPVIKTFKYEAHAYRFMKNFLLGRKH